MCSVAEQIERVAHLEARVQELGRIIEERDRILKERDAEAIAAGLVKTYDRAGKATARARRKLTEWRNPR